MALIWVLTADNLSLTVTVCLSRPPSLHIEVSLCFLSRSLQRLILPLGCVSSSSLSPPQLHGEERWLLVMLKAVRQSLLLSDN